MSKPYSQACENNKKFILDLICDFFMPGDQVLEIASGTGQHVCYFAEQMPQVIWLPSETEEGLPILFAGLEGVTQSNILAPVALNVQQTKWPTTSADGVFSANSLHIMSVDAGKDFIAGVGRVLKPGGFLCIYGPFKYEGEYTTSSNADFDGWLKHRDPQSGIRDFEQVDSMAKLAGLEIEEDYSMPANNQLLVWRKS